MSSLLRRILSPARPTPLQACTIFSGSCDAPDGGDGVERVDVVVLDVERAMITSRAHRPSAAAPRTAGTAQQHCDALRFPSDVEVTAEHVGELAPLPQSLVEVGEAVERLGVVAAEVEHLFPGRDRARHVADLLGEHAGELGADIRALAIAGCVLELTLEHAPQLGPLATLVVDALEGRDRGLVCGVELVEHALVHARRIIELADSALVAQAVFVDLTEPQMQLDELQLLFRGEQPLLEHLRKLRVLLERGVDAIELRQGLDVERLDAEDVAIRLLGPLDVAQLFLVQAREALADHGLDQLVVVELENGREAFARIPSPAHDAAKRSHSSSVFRLWAPLNARTSHRARRPGDELLCLTQIRDAVVPATVFAIFLCASSASKTSPSLFHSPDAW